MGCQLHPEWKHAGSYTRALAEFTGLSVVTINKYLPEEYRKKRSVNKPPLLTEHICPHCNVRFPIDVGGVVAKTCFASPASLASLGGTFFRGLSAQRGEGSWAAWWFSEGGLSTRQWGSAPGCPVVATTRQPRASCLCTSLLKTP